MVLTKAKPPNSLQAWRIQGFIYLLVSHIMAENI